MKELFHVDTQKCPIYKVIMILLSMSWSNLKINLKDFIALCEKKSGGVGMLVKKGLFYEESLHFFMSLLFFRQWLP